MTTRAVSSGIVVASVCAMLLSPSPGWSEWSQYRGNAARTGAAEWSPRGQERPDPHLRVHRRVEIGKDVMIDASPIIDHGGETVFVGTIFDRVPDATRRLLAFHAPNLELRWAVRGVGDVRAAPAAWRAGFTGPERLRRKGLAVVGHQGGGPTHRREFVSFVDALTGAVIKQSDAWTRIDHRAPLTHEHVTPDGFGGLTRIYVQEGSSTLTMYMRDQDFASTTIRLRTPGPVTGGVDWCDLIPIPPPPLLCPGFDPTGIIPPPSLPRRPSPVYSSACDDIVWAMHTGSGSAVRAGRDAEFGFVQKTGLLVSTPALGKAGRMYAVVYDEDDRRLYLDAYEQSGERAWRATAAGRPLPLGFPVSPPALGSAGSEGAVTRASCTNRSHGMRISDSRAQTVYVAAGLSLLAFNDNGSLRWRSTIPSGSRWGEPVVIHVKPGDERVVVAANHGDINELRMYRSDGTLLPRAFLDGPSLGSPAIDSINGMIYAATTHSLYAFGGRRDDVILDEVIVDR